MNFSESGNFNGTSFCDSAQFFQSSDFNLTDSLLGDPKPPADLFKRLRLGAFIESIAERDDFLFAAVEFLEHFADDVPLATICLLVIDCRRAIFGGLGKDFILPCAETVQSLMFRRNTSGEVFEDRPRSIGREFVASGVVELFDCASETRCRHLPARRMRCPI